MRLFLFEDFSGKIYMYLGKFHTYEYMCSGWGSRTEDERLEKRKAHLFVEIWSHYVPDLNKASVMHILKNQSNIYQVGYYDYRTSIPKFVKELAVKDLSGIDVVEVTRKIAEDYDKDNNPYPRNWHVNKLCIGVDKPYLHPKVAKKHLPIK